MRVECLQLSESQAAAIKAIHEYFPGTRQMLKEDLASGALDDVLDVSLKELLLKHIEEM